MLSVAQTVKYFLSVERISYEVECDSQIKCCSLWKTVKEWTLQFDIVNVEVVDFSKNK